MKNEDRIVEHLAKSLRNQDIQSGKLEVLSDKLDSLVDVVKDGVHALQHQWGIMEKVVRKYDKLDELEQRVAKIEKRTWS